MNKITIIIATAFLLVACSASAQTGQNTGVQMGNDVDDMDIIRSEVEYQLFIYKEVMMYLSDISESFSDGYIEPDAAVKKVMILRHTYNQKSEQAPKELKQLKELMNKMFSRLENYFIHFKLTYRENPYVNAKVAEAKFMVTQEAERLQYTYGEY